MGINNNRVSPHLWFGTGTSAAVAIVAYAAFFPLIVNTIAASVVARSRSGAGVEI